MTTDPSPIVPPQPQQPRWAWWLVGIVIPVLGLIVTLVVGSRNDSAGSEPPSVRAADKDATPAATVGAEVAGEALPPKVRFTGEVRIELGNGGESVDLDSTPPLVGQSFNGADIAIGATTDRPTLGTPDSGLRLAPLPASGPVPGEAECAAAVTRNGAYTAYLTRGARFCVQTRDGRTAYLRTVAAPAAGSVRIAVTVWEQPS